jgi:hypothetical protein
MRAFQNQVKGLAVAALVAAALVNASPAWAGQAATVNIGGSKVCIMLEGVVSNASDWVAATLGAVLEKLGC